MCRWIVYKGAPVWLCDIVTYPSHSLIKQAYDRYLPFIQENHKLSKETSAIAQRPHQVNSKINADGFGVGWYSKSVHKSNHPCTFHSIVPAPNNRNFRIIAEHVKTNLLFAHIRASSGATVQESNCHPFLFGSWMFMHNGAVGRFLRIKRMLTLRYSKEIYNNIEGTTDSEHVFGLFLDLLGSHGCDDVKITDIKEALLKTINIIIKLVKLVEVDNEPHMPSSLNLAVTNGSVVVASRYRDGDEDPPSLYYHLFSKYECINGEVAVHPIVPGEDAGAVIISSEPVVENEDGWILIPKNTILTCQQDNKIVLESIQEINDDKYYQEWIATTNTFTM